MKVRNRALRDSSRHLQGIAVFVSVVEAGSFAAAADRLGLTRSAVGKSIARLEDRLGIRLLERTTRSLNRTEAGEAFYQTCLSVLTELDEAETRLAAHRQSVSGRLRVSLPISFGRRWVLPILFELERANPGLQLDVSFTGRHVDLIEEGIDFVVRLGEPDERLGLIARFLGNQKWIICAAPSYLARRGTPRSLDELVEHDCLELMNGNRPVSWQLVDETGNFTTVKVAGRHSINYGDAILDAAVAGIGIARLPSWLVHHELRAGRLIQVLSHATAEHSPIHALWPRARDLLPRVRATVDALVANFLPVAPWDLE
jgi:DNA-binding transcriptional LysR family regulator